MNVSKQVVCIDRAARRSDAIEARFASACSTSAPLTGDATVRATSAAARREPGYSFDALHCAAEPQAISRAGQTSSIYMRIFALPFELRATIFRFARADLGAFELSRRAIPLNGDVRATRNAVKDAMDKIPAGFEAYAVRQLTLRLQAIVNEIPRADAVATLVQQSALRPALPTRRYAKNFAVDCVGGFTTEPIRQIVLNSVLENLRVTRNFSGRPALEDLDVLRNDDELFAAILAKCGTMRHSLIRSELLKRLLRKAQSADLGCDRKRFLLTHLHDCAEGIKLEHYRRPLQDSIMRSLAGVNAA